MCVWVQCMSLLQPIDNILRYQMQQNHNDYTICIAKWIFKHDYPFDKRYGTAKTHSARHEMIRWKNVDNFVYTQIHARKQAKHQLKIVVNELHYILSFLDVKKERNTKRVLQLPNQR